MNSASGERKLVYDNHGRPMNYLRLAVTDRCNLRCFYCMPEEGIKYLPKQALLTYEEMIRLTRILAGMGVSKIRITGGEPFVRKELMTFIRGLNAIEGIEEINITTNGVLTKAHIPYFKEAGIKSVNLSLDTLDKERFFKITRRNEFDKVMESFHDLLHYGIKTKINAVVMDGQNTEDIVPMTELSRDYPVSVRFIEEMPFNGEGSKYPVLVWTHRKILDAIKAQYPQIEKIDDGPNSTSFNYKVPGFKGSVGIIPAFTRSFCGTCNRIRLTAQGMLKTCLYDDGVLDIKKIIRSEASDGEVEDAFLSAFSNRAKDGFEAEKRREITAVAESMSTIGG